MACNSEGLRLSTLVRFDCCVSLTARVHDVVRNQRFMGLGINSGAPLELSQHTHHAKRMALKRVAAAVQQAIGNRPFGQEGWTNMCGMTSCAVNNIGVKQGSSGDPLQVCLPACSFRS